MLTEAIDLRGGRPCWTDPAADAIASDPLPAQTDVLVIGAGVTGAAIARRLAASGRTVALVDRRPPAAGSTAASTALLLWAADLPLSLLAARIGNPAAMRAWRRVHLALGDLARVIVTDRIDCGLQSAPDLYLAGDLLDDDALVVESGLRGQAGLPSRLLTPDEVADEFGLPPRAALLSQDCFSVDPVALAHGLLAHARRDGAQLAFPKEIVSLEQDKDGVVAHTAAGEKLRAADVVIATGYEAPRLFLPEDFALGASFAMATPPDFVAPGDYPMIWEAADPYLYARTTSDGRLIVGGEDLDGSDPARRDAQIGAKAGRLAAAGGAMFGRAPLPVDCAWAASFGRSPDGLPAIGRARNAERIWLASGFGGNGISFAALAAELIDAGLAGTPDPDAGLFDPYRAFGGTSTGNG